MTVAPTIASASASVASADEDSGSAPPQAPRIAATASTMNEIGVRFSMVRTPNQQLDGAPASNWTVA